MKYIKISPEKMLELRDKAERLDEVDWFCDNCDAYLNEQNGFTTTKGRWKCSKCGYTSSIHFYDIIDRD